MSTTVDRTHELPIPQPPEHLFGLLGNLPDVDSSFFTKSVWQLTDLYGEIYQLNLAGRHVIIASTYELLKDFMDDSKFEKTVSGALDELRPLIKDGLFSAKPGEPNWGKAHRLLMAVFGPLSVRKMFPEMKTIAQQMCDRWDRMGDGYEVVASDDFTRLAFDTIGKCGMGYNFFQFFSEHVHPFATQMSESLIEAGKIATRTRLENSLRIWSAQQMKDNIAAMHKLTDEIIADRKKHPQDRFDLLNVMLNEKDPVTGEKLSDENIRYQLVTFLIAGHETTSGTLSFLFYHLLNNPSTVIKATEEVDRVVGNDELDIKHIPQLKYIDACIKEALRFQGPISLLQRRPLQDIMLGGKYFIPKGASVVSSLHALHHDPAVWGADHNVFRPERMMDMSKIPAGAWKPFGTGERSCIGRAFAEQEMIAAVALMLQRYQIAAADPNYKLELKPTLTIKPLDFKFKIYKRQGKEGIPRSVSTQPAHAGAPHTAGPKTSLVSTGKPLKVWYGSNAGTCKSFAEEVQAAAPSLGYSAELRPLDEAVEQLTSAAPNVIITASYEGKPPDNARKFVAWLEASKDKKDFLKGVKFSIFGVGNPEWASTYQRVPKEVDRLMRAAGAEAICESVYADIKENAIGDFENWQSAFEKGLGSALASAAGVKPLKTAIIKSGTPGILGHPNMNFGIVREVRQLADNSVGPVKMHTGIELPSGSSYQSGDYLVVLPFNHPETVGRVLKRFELHNDDMVQVTETNKAHLLSDTPINAHEFFATRVELGNVATPRQIDTIMAATPEGAEKARLQAMNDDYKSAVLAKRFSIIDILEDHPSSQLDLSTYLDMLKPLTPRQYSISSSPLATLDPGSTKGPLATLTYDVHNAPALSGNNRTFHGVASSFLARNPVGSRVRCYVRRTNTAFHLPSDPRTPVIMVAAGSGLAPMRGFIQERAALAAARGADALGPAILYFGCRDFERDFIYKDELAAWEADGLVSVRPAFSRRGPPGATPNYKYVGERISAEQEELRTLFTEQGAKMFLCGSAGKLAKSVAETIVGIYRAHHPEKSEAEALAWFESIKETRYVSDVFD